MGIRENYELFKNSIEELKFTENYVSGATNPYILGDLDNLKQTIENLEHIDFLENDIEFLKNQSGLYKTHRNEDSFSSSEKIKISSTIDSLRIGLRYLIDYFDFNSNFSSESNAIAIKLPEVKDFDDLSKASNELKKSIELPIIDSSVIDGKTEILSAEQGSIWLMISLGSIAAVNLIGGICWAAMVIRKKRAEAKIFEEHAKTLNLKNDALEILVNAQKEQIDNVLKAEADAIISQHYDHNDPETRKRLELSINTTADLIDRGAKIIPAANNNPSKENFPEYKDLNLIQSAIKQIRGN